MKGKHKVIVQNNKLYYEFEIKRNITIIQGDSATGKTTLINMVRQAANFGVSSGIDILCDVPCRTLEGVDWKLILSNLSNHILFIDEENHFINTEEFAAAVRESDNYFVLITRENLYNLPYSVEEIYGLHSSGKYQNSKKIYQEMYRVYSNAEELPIQPETILVEDSNSGYDFFQAVSGEKDRKCVSAGGKSNIFSLLNGMGDEEICVVADGAAIGPEMSGLYKLAKNRKNIKLYLPESFEWLILKSGLIEGKEIQKILDKPEEYIDGKKYFSWERFFTQFLVENTRDTYLRYSKSRLNPAYLHEKNKNALLKCMEGIEINASQAPSVKSG